MFEINEIVNSNGSDYRLLKLLKDEGSWQLWECEKVNNEGKAISHRGSKWFQISGFDVIADE